MTSVNLKIANQALKDYRANLSISITGQCQEWVGRLYKSPYVNLPYTAHGPAWQQFMTNRSKGWAWDYYTGMIIPVGACVWWKPEGQGGYGGAYGHVGIYIDGFVFQTNFNSSKSLDTNGKRGKGVTKMRLSDFKTPAGFGWCCNPDKYNLPKAGKADNYTYSVLDGNSIVDDGGSVFDALDSAFGDDVSQQEEMSYSLEEVDRYEINVKGKQTFDAVDEDYHLVINGYDIVDYASEIELTEDIDELSATFSFKLPFAPTDDHIYGQFKQKINPKVGDWVYWYNYGNKQRDTELFRGIITNISTDWQITCNDVGWYLNKTEIIFQANNVKSVEAVKKLLKTAFPKGSGLEILPGMITDKLTSTVNKLWIGSTPAEILKYILGQNQEEKGLNFLYKVRKNKLNIMPYPTKLTRAYVRQAGGGKGTKTDYGYFDCTWLLEGVDGRDNIDELKNKVVAVAKNSETGNSLVEVKDIACIEKFARLQKVIELSDRDVDGGAAFAQSALKELDVIRKERSVSGMLGHDCIISGLIMEFSSNRYGLQGYWLVKRVTQKYQPYHTMSLDLINVVNPADAPKLHTVVNEENFSEIETSGVSIDDTGTGFVNVDTTGWQTTKASGYSPDDAGTKCADGTPFDWNTNCVAVGMNSGDWKKYKGKHIYVSYGGKTVESVVRDVGNFGAGGKYTNRTLDLGPAVWKSLGGLKNHEVAKWGVRTVSYKFID